MTIAGSGQGGQVAWINANGGDWSNATNWDAGRIPTTIDTVEIVLDGDYTVTLDTDATVYRLEIGGTSGTQALSIGGTTLTVNQFLNIGTNGLVDLDGTLTGTGNVGVYGIFDWAAGTVSSANFTVLQDGELMLTTAGTKTLDGPNVSSSGTISWLAGDLELLSGGIQNGSVGTFDAVSNGTLSGSATIVNFGTFDKGGADSTTIAIPFWLEASIAIWGAPCGASSPA